jgi:hypothetical protein
VVSSFTLLGIGYLQGASMMVLSIRLGCILDEIKGTCSKESMEKAAKLISYTYVFTGILSIASTAFAVCLMMWAITLFINGYENDVISQVWLNTDGGIYSAFAAILVVYLLLAYFGLRKKLHEIFGKKLGEEF